MKIIIGKNDAKRIVKTWVEGYNVTKRTTECIKESTASLKV